jgi:uncharacterized protein (TIGR03086 family)
MAPCCDAGSARVRARLSGMTEIADRYRRLSDAFAATVAAVPDDRWSSPSPCEDWDARALVGHVVNAQGMFLGFIGEELGDIPTVDDDPTAAWDAARGKVQSALDDPARADREFDGFLGRSSFSAAVDRFLSCDLVVHRWDLARATGQDDTIEPADAARVLEIARGFGDAFRSPGAFGPEVPVAADADVQTRMLAFCGRAA